MKRIILTSLFLLLSSMLLPAFVWAFGSKEQIVKPLSGITTVVLRSWGTLYVSQGDNERIEARGSDYQLSKLKAAVYGDTLVLSVEGIQTGLNRGNIDYYITLKRVSGIENHSNGSIECDSLQSEKLTLVINSTGTISIASLEAGRVFSEINGSGTISIEGGSCGIQYVDLFSTGDYVAPSFKSSRAEVNISGSGNAEIWAADSLDAVLLGSGNLKYYGEPVLDREVIRGTGSIRSLGPK